MHEFGFQWHITDRCNGRCAHCYQGDFSGARELGLDRLLDAAARIFEGLPGHRVSINVTGGEPLLVPHLVPLLLGLHERDGLEEVNVITNGSIADRALIGELAALPKLGCFKVSMESDDRGIDDALRWEGHFDAVTENVAAFAATGKPVVLMITLSRRNVASIPGIAALARRLGVAGVIYERFVPLGRGLGMRGDVLGPSDWSRAVRAIAAAAGVDAEPDALLPYKAFWLDTSGAGAEPLAGALCNLGPESMCLLPDGAVTPCRRLPIAVGDVFEEPFEAIRARLAGWSPGALGPRLAGLVCGRCGVDGCAGCRALAYALAGDPLADDPQCPLVADGVE
jgi:MoaA/NifB/PqqE/SkfB family radical SAM enzyme